jgi:AcrR family transcriptional regulator
MGQKDKLLEAAKRSLLTRGHAGTTARDLASDAGVSLAAIGYHFGSKDNLLDLAVSELLEDWAATVMSAISAPTQGSNVLEQLAAGWKDAIDGFDRYAPLLIAFYDALLRSQASEAARTRIAAHISVSRTHVKRVIEALVPAMTDDDAETAASFALAVVDGLFVQWLADRNAVPDGATFVASVRRVLAAMTANVMKQDK